MKVEFVRTGGFAGLRLACKFDTANLPAEQAARLHELIEEAGFFGLPAKMAAASPAPDRYEYRVAVSTSERIHTVVSSEVAVPDRLRPLLEYLTTLALVDRKR